MKSRLLLTTLSLLLGTFLGPATTLPAQEKEAGKQSSAAKKEGPEQSGDRYEVPAKANVTELVQFINELVKYRPENPFEAQLHQRRLPKVLGEAAAKIVEQEKDRQSEAFGMARGIQFELQIHGLEPDKSKAQKQLFDDFSNYLKDRKKLGAYEFALAKKIGSTFRQLDNEKLAASAYKSFGEVFRKASDEAATKAGESLLAAARQMELVGQPLKLQGTTMEGKEFDIKSMKGKVVLVDFWATWCGPCVAEYPNILRLYKKYHDQGFEVVGISLDENRFRLERYLSENKVPWTTLHEADQRGQHPAASYYGVESIPMMILVGRDGKVISKSARGEILARLLDEQFNQAKN